MAESTPTPTTTPTSTHWQRTTRGGVQLLIRAARPEDESVLEDLFRNVSPEDLRFRFLSAVAHVSPEQIRRMTHVDHQSAESWIALLSDGETPVASALLARDPSGSRAEVAISVRSDHRQRGIGWEMLAFVAEQAKARGIEVIESVESRDNRAALQVERDMNFTFQDLPGDPTLVLVSKRLSSARN